MKTIQEYLGAADRQRLLDCLAYRKANDHTREDKSMYSKEEMKVLNKIAKDWHGCKFNDLDFEEQDTIYCYAEDNGLL